MRSRLLDWPEERVGTADCTARLTHPGSNICLDVHGDPLHAQLVVFSDGNHHMALEESLRAFAQRHPAAAEICYFTTPPSVLVDTLYRGQMQVGNLRISLKPHIFLSPPSVLAKLAAEGWVQPPLPFMRSRGFVFLVRKGNPKHILSVKDLLRPDVRLFLSNPATETASYQAYTDCLRALANRAGITLPFLAQGSVESGQLCYGEVIHHREAPQALADERADVALLYYHLALRFERIFPDMFEVAWPEGGVGELGCTDSQVHMSMVGDGGSWGELLFDFLRSAVVTSIYQAHGLERLQ